MTQPAQKESIAQPNYKRKRKEEKRAENVA
jgi:hypothetical protein